MVKVGPVFLEHIVYLECSSLFIAGAVPQGIMGVYMTLCKTPCRPGEGKDIAGGGSGNGMKVLGRIDSPVHCYLIYSLLLLHTNISVCT